MPKIGSDGTIHTSIIRRKLKDGSVSVQEVQSVYDPATQNSKVLKTKTLGTLPPGENDMTKLIAPGTRKKRAKAPAAAGQAPGHAAAPSAAPADTAMAHYPLDALLVAAAAAWIAGCSTPEAIAGYIRNHLDQLRDLYPDFPEAGLSARTVACLIEAAGWLTPREWIRQMLPALLGLRTPAGGRLKALTAAVDSGAPEFRGFADRRCDFFVRDDELALRFQLTGPTADDDARHLLLISDNGALVGCMGTQTGGSVEKAILDCGLYDVCLPLPNPEHPACKAVARCFKNAAQPAATAGFETLPGIWGARTHCEAAVLPVDRLKKAQRGEHTFRTVAECHRPDTDPASGASQTLRFMSTLHAGTGNVAALMARLINRLGPEAQEGIVLDLSFPNTVALSRDRTFGKGLRVLESVAQGLSLWIQRGLAGILHDGDGLPDWGDAGPAPADVIGMLAPQSLALVRTYSP